MAKWRPPFLIGYSYNGRTLSPEKVAVYTYEKPVQETEKSEKSEGMNNG